MNIVTLMALLQTAAPLLAPVYTDADGASRPGQVCALVEVQHRSGHFNRRVCLTDAEWRRRLGNDWRSVLSGRSLDDDLDALEVRTRNNPMLPRRGR